MKNILTNFTIDLISAKDNSHAGIDILFIKVGAWEKHCFLKSPVSFLKSDPKTRHHNVQKW